MIKKYNLFLLILAALFINACGGDGDSSFEQEKVNISECIDNPTSTIIDNYEKLNSGDSIVQDISSSQVTTYHSLDGVKRVCLNSGKAHIIRK